MKLVEGPGNSSIMENREALADRAEKQKHLTICKIYLTNCKTYGNIMSETTEVIMWQRI